jgi:cyclopropane fatty-acyl-phospholipid synthase-like methyltransferase
MTNAIDYEPAAHYDRVTDVWSLLLGEDLHYGVFETGAEPLCEATRALTQRMLDASRLAPGLRVLDVGCGNGAPACLLAEGFGVVVLGITTSQVGVDRACQRAAAAGLSDVVAFELRDGTDNGLPDESFDRAWVLESSHLMRDRDRLVNECARILRPGGRFVLCDIIRKRDIPFLELRERREEFQALRAAFGDAHMQPLEVYASLATDAGLEVDDLVDLTDATLQTFDRWQANAAAHEAEAVNSLGTEGFEAFVRSCNILESFWGDGPFGYGLISASKPS